MPQQTVAIVANPTKLDDAEALRQHVTATLAEHRWHGPLWLETTAQDAGEGQAREAVRGGARLVLAAGGDGTVTACAAGLVGSGVPLGILPAGTGNLLARNLALPLDLDEALVAALTGADRELDVGVANGRIFLAMAGLGLDATMLASTSEAAKRRFGWAAYALSMARHLGDRPMRVTITTDGGRPRRHRAAGVIVGNVGWLQGGLPLLPAARPDDGRLDAVVLAGRGLADWIALGTALLLRREADRALRTTFTRLRIDTDREHLWELDGEVIGPTRSLSVGLHSGRLLVRVPSDAAPARLA